MTLLGTRCMEEWKADVKNNGKFVVCFKNFIFRIKIRYSP